MALDASLGLILTTIWVFCSVVFACFLLFARAVNIERPILVGCLTLLTSAVAAVLILNEFKMGLRSEPRNYIPIAMLSVIGYGVGRVVDYLLGPVTPTEEETEPNLGADLAD
jgi:hypothetical protein